MMKTSINMKTIYSSVICFLTCCFAGAQSDKASLLQKVSGFSHPESVVYDEVRDVVYVSNIGEREAGDGFISRVSKNGDILELHWITGLEDPKGLQIKEEKLYVTDNTRLVEMSIPEGRVTRSIEIEDSQFLNDISIDDQGTLYISDSGKSAIYTFDPSGEINEWLATEELRYPNGLLVVDDKIYVAAWGGENGGPVLEVDRRTRGIEPVSSKDIGNLDGIQKLPNEESFYISDWASGNIYKIDADGTIKEILTSEKSAGDILFLPEEKKLALPMNHQNEVWWYELND